RREVFGPDLLPARRAFEHMKVNPLATSGHERGSDVGHEFFRDDEVLESTVDPAERLDLAADRATLDGAVENDEDGVAGDVVRDDLRSFPEIYAGRGEGGVERVFGRTITPGTLRGTAHVQ